MNIDHDKAMTWGGVVFDTGFRPMKDFSGPRDLAGTLKDGSDWEPDYDQLAEVEVNIANETQTASKGCNFGGSGVGPGVDDQESGEWDSRFATIKVKVILYAFTNIATGRADDMYCQSGAYADGNSNSCFAHAYDGATLFASWLVFQRQCCAD